MSITPFKFFLVLVVSILVPINLAVAAKLAYSIKEIGELPVGITHVVRSANESGDIVGTLKRGKRGPDGATWNENEGRRDINTRMKSDYTTTLGINDSKHTVGSVNTQTGMRAFRSLEDGSSMYLDQLPNDTSSAAIAINGSGRVVGWSSGSSGIKAVTWNDIGKVESLPNLPGSNSCRALVINDGGDIAGACDFSSGSRAVLWKENSRDEAVDLGFLPGDTWSIPTGMNKKGDIVGNSGSEERHNAVLWPKNGKAIKNLGVLSGRVSSRALGINNDGDVVGYSEGGHSRDHAFIWTSKTGMKDLNELVPSGSGFVLVQAIAINSKGNISAVGYDESMNPDGHLHSEQVPLRIFTVRRH